MKKLFKELIELFLFLPLVIGLLAVLKISEIFTKPFHKRDPLDKGPW